MEKAGYIHWDDEAGKAKALKSLGAGLDGVANLYKKHSVLASDLYRDSLPNISVRDEFNRGDYDAFRPGESSVGDYRKKIFDCNEAYKTNGLIKNVVDLMADFACQGISLTHPQKRKEKFFREWGWKVDLKGVSERFCSTLLRKGQTPIKKNFAKLNLVDIENVHKGFASADIEIEKLLPVVKNEIPWEYTILNPANLEVLGEELALFTGNYKYAIKISDSIIGHIKRPKKGSIEEELVNEMPKDIVDAVRRGEKSIRLNGEKFSIFFYKKDDDELWADPMIYCVLNDIKMLNKTKLADLAALDGAISYIRLWKLGNLEHKIIPNPAAMQNLADILISNVGGGTMDLVWGPDIELQETSSEIYKFLGQEKYIPILNAIYAGLGIPPTLTGAATSGGFTNNYISLKTLTERLAYIRSLLVRFWENEISIVQRAMGFASPAQLRFDRMNLTDEAAEKALLLQLADRNLVSIETIQERFGESPEIEQVRLKREERAREKGKSPRKAGPWNNPEHEEALEKIALQKGLVSPSEVGLELEPKKNGETREIDIKKKQAAQKPVAPAAPPGGPLPLPNNGRPKNSKDTGQRKKKQVKIRTSADLVQAIGEAKKLQKEMIGLVTPMYLASINKKNLRELSAEEEVEVEAFYQTLLCNLSLDEEINLEVLRGKLDTLEAVPEELNSLVNQCITTYVDKNGRTPTLAELRDIHASSYVVYYVVE